MKKEYVYYARFYNINKTYLDKLIPVCDNKIEFGRAGIGGDIYKFKIGQSEKVKTLNGYFTKDVVWNPEFYFVGNIIKTAQINPACYFILPNNELYKLNPGQDTVYNTDGKKIWPIYKTR